MNVTHGVVAGYDRRHPVIHDLTVTVQAGETLALAGPSGSGKSTLARVLSLLHQPFAGTVSVNGRQVLGYRHRAPRELRIRIGVVFQQPRLSIDPRMTLRRAIAEPLAAVHTPDIPARVDQLADLVDAGVLAISHDTVLPDRWADRTLHLSATGHLSRHS
jgi:ABC-type glutathione transport system ATPase component